MLTTMPSFSSKASSSGVFSVPDGPKRFAQAKPGAKATTFTCVCALASKASVMPATKAASASVLDVPITVQRSFFVVSFTAPGKARQFPAEWNFSI